MFVKWLLLLILLSGCVEQTTRAVLPLATTQIGRAGSNNLYPQKTGSTNPDITQENINKTICNSGVWKTSSIRPPTSYTNKLKMEEISNYADKNMSHYEEDHIIPLELGGHPTDTTNLWAEPYPDAYLKDRVENGLKKEVCDGVISLQQAQSIITTDWYKCYLTLEQKGVC